MRALSWLLLVFVASGCYRVHEREAGRPDAASGRDAGHDAVSPVDGLGAFPDAADPPPDAWRADASRPSHVVLTPIGDPIPVDDSPGMQGGTPVVAWNGSGWGVAWMSIEDVRLRLLDADAQPLGPSVVVTPGSFPTYYGMTFETGRYAVVTAHGGAVAITLMDRNAQHVPPVAALFGGGRGGLARLELGGRWVAAMRDAARTDRIIVATVNDAMMESEPRLEIPGHEPGPTDDGDVSIASLKTRLLAAWVTGRHLQAIVLGGTPLTTLSRVLDLDPLGGVSDREDMYPAIEPSGDHFVVAAPDGSAIRVFFVDPWSTRVRGPFRVGVTGITDRRPGIAPIPEHALAGICYASGRGPYGGDRDMNDGIDLTVVDDDGTVVSDTLAVASHLVNAGGAACAWNGNELVVIWWRAEQNNQLFAQRVAVAFP